MGYVFVQGIIHLNESQQQVVRYEAIREDAGLLAFDMFSSFLITWAKWVEDMAPISVKPDPDGGAASWISVE
eukprot:6618049-Prorocentrum_lima.AAC.1